MLLGYDAPCTHTICKYMVKPKKPRPQSTNWLSFLRNHVDVSRAIDTSLVAIGTPEDVRTEVIRVMGILRPSGRYICGPDQSIPGIPPENMTALWDAAREVGQY